MRYIQSIAAILLCVLVCSRAGGASQYSFTDLGDLPDGSAFAIARGINNTGQVAGRGSSSAGTRAFLWNPLAPNGNTGTMYDLGAFPTGTVSAGNAINDSGQVVGNGVASAQTHAMLWSPSTPNGSAGTMVDLGTLPERGQSEATAINASGQVAGFGFDNSTTDHAFIWKPSASNATTGSMIPLGDLPGGSDLSRPFGINNFGQVVGRSSGSDGTHAFLWTPSVSNGTSGTMVDLGDLPGGISASQANDINESGQVVGYSYAASGPRAIRWTPTTPNGNSGTMLDLGLISGASESFANAINTAGDTIVGNLTTPSGDRAFVWTSTGGMQNLNTLLDANGAGWTLTEANAINDSGQIVGRAFKDLGGGNFVTHAFLLTPVPEPSTAGLLLATSVLLRGRRRSF